MESLTTSLNNFLTPILGFFIAYLLFVLRHERERRTEIEKKLSDQKYQMYTTLIKSFFDLFVDAQSNLDNSGNLGKEHMLKFRNSTIEFRKNCSFYAPDYVITSFLDYTNHVPDKDNENEDAAVILEKMAKIILSIRQDMGFPKTKLSPRAFAALLIVEYRQLASPGKFLHAFEQKFPRNLN